MTAPVTPTGPVVVTHTQLPEHDGATGAMLYREAFATLEGVERRLAGEDFFDIAGLAGMPDDLGRSALVSMELDALLGELRTSSRCQFEDPNGDVIEVQVLEPARLVMDLANVGVRVRGRASLVEVCAAWNAEHGIGIESQRVIYEGDPECGQCAQLKQRTDGIGIGEGR